MIPDHLPLSPIPNAALPHVAGRLFCTPLAIHQGKLETILGAVSPRLLNGDDLPPISGSVMTGAEADVRIEGGVAIIPVIGTTAARLTRMNLMSGAVAYPVVTQQVLYAVRAPEVSAIVLEIDSYGGEVSGLFSLHDLIRAMTKYKPIVAAVSDEAYSAGYALAAAASSIFMPETGGVGSIGVVAAHLDVSARDGQEGKKYTFVTAGKHKLDGNPHVPLSDSARERMQVEVDRLAALFATKVAANRKKLTPEKVLAMEAGVFFGQDAVDVGLVDRIGNLSDAVAEARRLVQSSGQPPQGGSPRNTNRRATVETNEASPPTTTPPVASAVDETAIRERAASAEAARAKEIADLCTLAGRPDLIAGFLGDRTSVSAVRERLLAVRAAQQSDPIDPNRTDPSQAAAAVAQGWDRALARLNQSKRS